MAYALDFHPEKIPVPEFPYPPGSGVTGSLGVLHTVTDRDGFAFLACCAAHERAGTASGYYAQREKGRILGEYAAAGEIPDDCGRDDPVTEWQESDVGTVLPCGCEVDRFNIPCGWHAEQYGPARPSPTAETAGSGFQPCCTTAEGADPWLSRQRPKPSAPSSAGPGTSRQQ